MLQLEGENIMYTRQAIWSSQGGNILPFTFMKISTAVILWLLLWALMPAQYQDLVLYFIGVK